MILGDARGMGIMHMNELKRRLEETKKENLYLQQKLKDKKDTFQNKEEKLLKMIANLRVSRDSMKLQIESETRREILEKKKLNEQVVQKYRTLVVELQAQNDELHLQLQQQNLRPNDPSCIKEASTCTDLNCQENVICNDSEQMYFADQYKYIRLETDVDSRCSSTLLQESLDEIEELIYKLKCSIGRCSS